MVRNMEKHYVFKSLFEDNITQVSSFGGKAHLCTLSDIFGEQRPSPSNSPTGKNHMLINQASVEVIQRLRNER